MTENNKALAIRDDMSLADLGGMLARSGYFQDAKDAAQAVVKVLAGREMGFGPIASMTGVYIVKGRVSLSANLMAAAMDTLLAAVTELARLAPDESTMNSKQREHARAAFDRGFPGEALR